MAWTLIALILVVQVAYVRTLTSKCQAGDSSKIDPDICKNVTELIRSKGYPCEEYTVNTSDGFFLGVQRIPHGIVKRSGVAPVVFLQHGLLCSSTDWVTNLANQSLAFILADAGFDVWLGNIRGNFYSRRHAKYNPNSDEFWDFSWDEMAKFDLPAMVDFALLKTGQKQLYYVGHSQGTLIAFAQLSHDKNLAQKVKLFVALGPVSTVGNIRGPLHMIAHMNKEIQRLFKLFGVREFMPHSYIMNFFAETVCRMEKGILCQDVIFLIEGADVKQLNQSRLPVYLSHTPAGTSVRNIVHFAQMIQSGVFQMYDYGSTKENLKRYGQNSPPQYNTSMIHTPIALFTAQNDWLSDPKDVEHLLSKLPNIIVKEQIAEWDHLDFIWAMDAPQLLYGKIIELLRRNPIV